MTTRLDGSEAKKLRWAFAGGLDKVRRRIWKVRPAGKTNGLRETIGRSVSMRFSDDCLLAPHRHRLLHPVPRLLRAAWMAQELLSTFGADLGEVALAPRTGGVFEITCDGLTIWERKADGGFPDIKVLNSPLTKSGSADSLRLRRTGRV